ncbi:MAG TPA: phosphoribosylaminoimidazolesuccinocarboxamide synthase, partial [Steroidobacteraceae bacterium]|nr:phosphoribosylaminoimidazolesuccinocarboxamide synthase [Steroidobacteraceae bacterium]
MNTPPSSLHESNLDGLRLVHRGKVRDVYAIDDSRLLIVATDRLSAFDVILPDPIPGKGRILNSISNFWFARTGHIVPNHLLQTPLEEVLPDPAERARVTGRSVVARRLKALPIEAVVRGYLIG